ncbi:hypothetical protein J3F83DRAFT_756746 [Trichoderma novae-zelandiae]
MPQVKGAAKSPTPEEELEDQIRHDLRNLRLKRKTPVKVYKRCAELRYGKSEGVDDACVTRPGCLGPDVLDIVAFTAIIRTSSARKVSKIEKLGVPTGLQPDFARLALSTAWERCYQAISKSDPRLGYLYITEVGRYLHVQHASLQPGLPSTMQDYIAAKVLAAKNPIDSDVRLAIGDYLLLGLQASYRWRSEKATDTLTMYLPLKIQADCVLQAWVGSVIGKHFYNAQMEPVEALEWMLGTPVFDAMKSSRMYREGKKRSQREEEKEDNKKEEEEEEDEDDGEELQGQDEGRGEGPVIQRGTGAIRVMPNGNDFEITVFLDFLQGFAIYSQLFAS